MTPHITAKKEDIAKIVLLPGDPLRAKYIAEKMLTNWKLVSSVRNILFYTGEYKGQKITIGASGMGCPSIGIYSYELFKFYDVDCIIRTGTAGSYTEEVKIKDMVLASSAYGENNFAKIAAGLDTKIMPSSSLVNEVFTEVAESKNIKLTSGVIHSSDVFYRKNFDEYKEIHKKYNAICCEMESFALFSNALVTNKHAGCILTISDSLVTHEKMSAEDRQKNVTEMFELSLDASIEILKKLK